MPSLSRVTLSALAALLLLAPAGIAQTKPQPAKPQSKPSKPVAVQPAATSRRVPRLEDAIRAKYVRRKLPREQRRVQIKGSEAAVHAGLVWLKKHQSADGRWDCDGFMAMDKGDAPCDGAGNVVHDVGVTGLALLAFLGSGNTHKRGLFQAQVKKGVEWLVEQQSETTGRIGKPLSHDSVYGHVIATYALVEAYGLSQDEALKPAAQGGINYLEAHRNPFGVWRYQPRDGDNDMSITSWAICAYRSAEDFKLDVNENALKIAAGYMDALTDPTNGRTGYTKRGEQSSRHAGDHSTRFPPERGEAMTAASLFCRLMLGQTPDDQPIIKLQAELILTKPPRVAKGSRDFYYWYYASHAIYQIGGKYWEAWYEPLNKVLVKKQREDGNFKGSWDPNCAWGGDGGRVYSTAMGLLTLQSEYRYARLLPPR